MLKEVVKIPEGLYMPILVNADKLQTSNRPNFRATQLDGAVRYSIAGKVYQIRGCGTKDILNILLRDGQKGPDCSGSPIRYLTISSDKPDAPLGFYSAGDSIRYPQTLELNYDYVSPEQRGQNLGLIQLVDFLRLALEMDGIKMAVFIPLVGRSNFGDSLDGICTRHNVGGWLEYDIDLIDRKKVKEVLTGKLKDRGIEIL